LFDLNRLDEALVSYDMAIKHNPKDSAAYYNRGLCLFDLNRLDEALVSFDMAIKNNPNHVKALKYREVLSEKLFLLEISK
jgi:tetratricopeptide (TPR) repeat protein